MTDILEKIFKIDTSKKSYLRMSQGLTLILGTLAVFLALNMQNVLELMLYSYAFMVSGLFVPVIGAFFWKRSSSYGAFFAMIFGGGTTITLIIISIPLPFGLDANIFGILNSVIAFVIFSYLIPNGANEKEIKPADRIVN